MYTYEKGFETEPDVTNEMIQKVDESIFKWIEILKGGEDNGGANCPLCVHYRRNSSCIKCPVCLKVDNPCCDGTPYTEWTHCFVHLKEMPYQIEKAKDETEAFEAAIDEIIFLRGLKDELIELKKNSIAKFVCPDCDSKDFIEMNVKNIEINTQFSFDSNGAWETDLLDGEVIDEGDINFFQCGRCGYKIENVDDEDDLIELLKTNKYK